MIGVESAALLADGIYTQRARHRYPDMFREVDPLARLVPLVLIVYGTAGAVHGARELRRAERDGQPFSFRE